jgi:hypothetical protein
VRVGLCCVERAACAAEDEKRGAEERGEGQAWLSCFCFFCALCGWWCAVSGERGRGRGTNHIFRCAGLALLLGARAGPRWLRARSRRRPPCGHCPCMCRRRRHIRIPTTRRRRCPARAAAPQGHTTLPRRPARPRGSPARAARRTARRTRRRGGRRRRGTACGGGGASAGRSGGRPRASSQSRPGRRRGRTGRLWSGAGRRCGGTRARALGGPCRGRSPSCRSRARCRRRRCRTWVREWVCSWGFWREERRRGRT